MADHRNSSPQDTPEQARLRVLIEAHPLLTYPKDERLTHHEEWNQFFLLVMQFKGFLHRVEQRLAIHETVVNGHTVNVETNAMLEDEAEVEKARFASSNGKRKEMFDSLAFAEALRTAVRNFDASKLNPEAIHGSPFLAYFDTLYGQRMYKNANTEADQRSDRVQRLSDEEIDIWRRFSDLCRKMEFDPKTLSAAFYNRMAELMGVSADKLRETARKCAAAQQFVSVESARDAEGEGDESLSFADPKQASVETMLERTAEAMRAITSFADLDEQEYPRLFFTNDVLAPMCADEPKVDPADYCSLLERSEELLWGRIFVREYINYVFAPPPEPDTLRHILAAERRYPLRDATIAACKQVTAAAISYRRKKYTELIRRLAQAENFA